LDKHRWRLLDLGALDGLTIQTVYEAVAESVSRGDQPSTLILCTPSHPYVCIGVHQLLEREVDLDYCQQQGLPVVRRQAGGGAVYLNGGQQFYQVVVRGDEPWIPRPVNDFYALLLKPTVYVYSSYGLEAAYRPPNDVVVSGRKASGNAALTLGRARVLIGNVIQDIDPELVSRVLRVPSEKFRDKLAESLRQWLTSLRHELGYTPPVEEVKARLLEGYRRELGVTFSPGHLSLRERNTLETLKRRYGSSEWLHRRSLAHPTLAKGERGIKLAGGILLCETVHKAGKLVRVILRCVEERIDEILISGDFSAHPVEAITQLEQGLTGTLLDDIGRLTSTIRRLIDRLGLQLEGVTARDLASAIMNARRAVRI